MTDTPTMVCHLATCEQAAALNADPDTWGLPQGQTFALMAERLLHGLPVEPAPLAGTLLNLATQHGWQPEFRDRPA